MRLIIVLILFSFFCSCNTNHNTANIEDWTRDLSIYEIMPKQYSETRNFRGITQDLDRIKSMFFNAICLLPIQTRDESNNPYNPNSPFALKSLVDIDENLGTALDLKELIDSSHARQIKVLIEWHLNGTGPHHPWRKQHPQYYRSDSQKIDNNYNQDFVKFNPNNEELQNALKKSIISFMKSHNFDGIVLYQLDQYPKNFISSLVNKLKSIRPVLVINYSPVIIKDCDYNINTRLFSHLESAYEGILNTNAFDSMLNIIYENNMVNFVQDYLLNEKHGSDAMVFYNAYRYYHSLTYFLPGIPWVLNGQEDPQFERINLFSNKPFLRKFKYNNDFYRSLNLLRQTNKALFENDPNNLPIRISESKSVLALERTSEEHSCIGLFNLSDSITTYKISREYLNYYDAFNKVRINLKKDTELQLGPFQSLIITNIP